MANLLVNLFGTDGIRGRANEYPLDGQTLIALGKAMVSYLLAKSPNSKPRVVIGRDPRVSSSPIEALISESLIAFGCEVYLLGVLPTPAVPILTRSFDADLGVMITASHNPYWDNGIKIFNQHGVKLAERDEIELTALILEYQGSSRSLPRSSHESLLQYLDGTRIYVQSLLSSFPVGRDLEGFRLAIDLAHGAASDVVLPVFKALGAVVHSLAHTPDGFNINENCGALHPERVAQVVLETQSNLGIALDGDGDRCVLIDENGQVLSGDEILGICALDQMAQGRLTTPVVVSTVLANIGLEMALFQHGISLARAQVGDRNVIEQMMIRGSVLGGESSGHFIFLNHSTTGDGVLTALQVLELMLRLGQPLSELRKSIRLLPQVVVNVQVKRKDPFSSCGEIIEVISSVQETLQNRGRVLVRHSGTEPVVRVMLEGEDIYSIRALCNDIASVIDRNMNY